MRFKALNVELSSALERLPLELMAVSEEVQEQVSRSNRAKQYCVFSVVTPFTMYPHSGPLVVEQWSSWPSLKKFRNR